MEFVDLRLGLDQLNNPGWIYLRLLIEDNATAVSAGFNLANSYRLGNQLQFGGALAIRLYITNRLWTSGR